MSKTIHLEIELSGDLANLRLPTAVAKRFQTLLNKQNQGESLSAAEKREAEGLTDLEKFCLCYTRGV